MFDAFVESANERRKQIVSTSQLFASAASSLESELENGWLMRPLKEFEIATMRGPLCRCKCRDWSNLRLLLRQGVSMMDQSCRLEELVSDTTFVGTVVLGVDDNEDKGDSLEERDMLPPGIHSNTLIANCILAPHCRVYRNTWLRDTHVCPHGVVVNCGDVSSQKGANYGNMEITVGAESGGGRKLRVAVEDTMMDVCRDLMMQDSAAENLRRHEFVSDFNIVGPHACARDTKTIQNIYLSQNSAIEAATSVKNAVLLPQARVSNSSTASNVLLQWNSCISDQSNVSDTLLMEHSRAGPHSTCASSVLGPDVHISTGEVHASVIGPNTNAHHQSLVIGVLWPLGRGNVGYGANVGSNHTGRLPDQETCAGEGTFWGLSCVVKFPVNLLQSPYSIVAAGTTVIPQRVTMPFSLLVDGKEGSSQILPGWVLSSSPYTLLRSEQKFANRRKAKRHNYYTGYKIFRPDIIDMCIVARNALTNVSSISSLYNTEKDVAGIGKNQLSEKARLAGIDTYTSCVQRYALRGLLDMAVSTRMSGYDLVAFLQRECSLAPVSVTQSAVSKVVSWPVLPWQENESTLWSHQRSVLQNEFSELEGTNVNAAWLAEVLHKLVEMEIEHANAVYQCKKRDDVRGEKTVPGYIESHVSADKDPVIAVAREDAHRVEESVKYVLADLSGNNTMNDATETRSRL